MRYVLRKYVDAANAKEALKRDRKTPVHDIYLKEGEEPRKGSPSVQAVGFYTVEPFEGEDA